MMQMRYIRHGPEQQQKGIFQMKKSNTKRIVGIGLFTAIVIVLQLISMALRFGTFSITLVLIPVVVGAALYGVGAGAWLGLVFGFAVLISGDASSFMLVHPLGTVLTVLCKGAAAGLVSGAVYRLLEKKSVTLAVAVASVLCPITNTGVFLLGCKLFFMPTITQWAQSMGFESVGAYIIGGLVGINFLIEFVINVVLNPAVVRLISFGKKK